MELKTKQETVSIAEPLQNRQHAQSASMQSGPNLASDSIRLQAKSSESVYCVTLQERKTAILCNCSILGSSDEVDQTVVLPYRAGAAEQGGLGGAQPPTWLIYRIAPPLFVSQKYFAGPFLEPYKRNYVQ